MGLKMEYTQILVPIEQIVSFLAFLDSGCLLSITDEVLVKES
jgi:hypothetical protein